MEPHLYSDARAWLKINLNLLISTRAVVRDQVGVTVRVTAGVLNMDDDGMIQVVQPGAGDDRIVEDLTPFGKAASPLERYAEM